VLQRAAVCCSVLQCAAVCCSVLSVLQCAAACCIVDLSGQINLLSKQCFVRMKNYAKHEPCDSGQMYLFEAFSIFLAPLAE